MRNPDKLTREKGFELLVRYIGTHMVLEANRFYDEKNVQRAQEIHQDLHAILRIDPEQDDAVTTLVEQYIEYFVDIDDVTMSLVEALCSYRTETYEENEIFLLDRSFLTNEVAWIDIMHNVFGTRDE